MISGALLLLARVTVNPSGFGPVGLSTTGYNQKAPSKNPSNSPHDPPVATAHEGLFVNRGRQLLGHQSSKPLIFLRCRVFPELARGL